MPHPARTIAIVERDGATVRIVGTGPAGSLEVIADLSHVGNRIVLSGLHADGAGPNTLGRTELLEFARLLADQEGATIIEVHGGRRTTGAKPGKVPRPVVFSFEV